MLLLGCIELKKLHTNICIIFFFVCYSGDGMFKYVQEKKLLNRKDSLRNRNNCNDGNSGCNKWSAKDDIPMFMGMPIFKKNPEVSAPTESNESDFTRNVRNARKSSIDASTYNVRSRSRSSSRTRMNSASRSSLNSKLW